ncbi:hypothetical protein BRADI_3g17509v3 [Brachypodium distachyon]|uniref:Uncharacterized protein n=1 Tax=Brachypodium distachyon TaxID=15368 RepID=A0A2K2CXT2_BRADI|nr:hypothetical protein BRADI_3g17509v3 [Brachypodium distachyon]
MRSSDSLGLSKRCSVKSRRRRSTWACSSGVPASASNSHTSLPKNLLFERSHSLPLPPPTPTFSLHILLLRNADQCSS